MMKRERIFGVMAAYILAVGSFAAADLIRGINIDFVPISSSTNPTSGIFIEHDFTFTGVDYNYRIGTYEVSNAQWNAFVTAAGAPSGSPENAYDDAPVDPTALQRPTNNVSWYEAAQFCNYLTSGDKSKGAYRFSGTNDHPGYFQFTDRDMARATYGTIYVIPTENEWFKAAYWNGTSVQAYATKAGDTLFQGDGTHDGWNYADGELESYDPGPHGPGEGTWDITLGNEELNGTFNMMGNVWEPMETPYSDDFPTTGVVRGGSYRNSTDALVSTGRLGNYAYSESYVVGFRIAEVPEPMTLSLLALGGLALGRKRR